MGSNVTLRPEAGSPGSKTRPIAPVLQGKIKFPSKMASTPPRWSAVALSAPSDGVGPALLLTVPAPPTSEWGHQRPPDGPPAQYLFGLPEGFARLCLEHRTRPSSALRAVFVAASPFAPPTTGPVGPGPGSAAAAAAIATRSGRKRTRAPIVDPAELHLDDSEDSDPPPRPRPRSNPRPPRPARATSGGLPGLLLRLSRDGHGELEILGPGGTAAGAGALRALTAWRHPRLLATDLPLPLPGAGAEYPPQGVSPHAYSDDRVEVACLVEDRGWGATPSWLEGGDGEGLPVAPPPNVARFEPVSPGPPTQTAGGGGELVGRDAPVLALAGGGDTDRGEGEGGVGKGERGPRERGDRVVLWIVRMRTTGCVLRIVPHPPGWEDWKEGGDAPSHCPLLDHPSLPALRGRLFGAARTGGSTATVHLWEGPAVGLSAAGASAPPWAAAAAVALDGDDDGSPTVPAVTVGAPAAGPWGGRGHVAADRVGTQLAQALPSLFRHPPPPPPPPSSLGGDDGGGAQTLPLLGRLWCDADGAVRTSGAPADDEPAYANSSNAALGQADGAAAADVDADAEALAACAAADARTRAREAAWLSRETVSDALSAPLPPSSSFGWPPCLLRHPPGPARAAAAASLSRLRLCLLGTGCAEPSPGRASSCLLLVREPCGADVPGGTPGPAGHVALAMEAGEGAAGACRRHLGASGADAALAGLRCLWISHRHADHAAGITGFLEAAVSARARLAAARGGTGAALAASAEARGAPPVVVVGPPAVRRLLADAGWLHGGVSIGSAPPAALFLTHAEGNDALSGPRGRPGVLLPLGPGPAALREAAAALGLRGWGWGCGAPSWEAGPPAHAAGPAAPPGGAGGTAAVPPPAGVCPPWAPPPGGGGGALPSPPPPALCPRLADIGGGRWALLSPAGPPALESTPVRHCPDAHALRLARGEEGGGVGGGASGDYRPRSRRSCRRRWQL